MENVGDLMSDKPSPTRHEFFYSRITATLYLISTLALFSIWVTSSVVKHGFTMAIVPPVIVLIAMVGGIFFFAPFRRLFFKGPVLIISEMGFQDRTVMREPVAWEKISAVNIKSVMPAETGKFEILTINYFNAEEIGSEYKFNLTDLREPVSSVYQTFKNFDAPLDEVTLEEFTQKRWWRKFRFYTD